MTTEEKANILSNLNARKAELEALVTDAVYGLHRNLTFTRAFALQAELNAVQALIDAHEARAATV